MKTGSFCGIGFTVSDKVIKTIQSFQWNTTGKWTTHQRHGQKDLPEKIGENLDTVSFTMTLSAAFGVNPMTQYKKLRDICSSGKSGALVIGKTRVGSKWIATKTSISAKKYDREGSVLSADVSVTLQEYV